MLDFDFRVRTGQFELHAAGVQNTPRMGLFGPSGCGKTTLLHCLAGLLRPWSGHIRFGERTLFDSEAGIALPPQKRRVGYVFQDGRLFPHKTVRANLAYGRRGAEESGVSIDELVDVLDLAPFLDRLPEALSGGQRQRVALGRALAAGPELLLLDEPLASIDEPARLRILTYLRQAYRRWRVPFVYVSHSLTEVLFLADSSWLMEHGRIIRQAEPHDLVAGTDAGPNPVQNVLTGVVLVSPEHSGYARVDCGGQEFRVPDAGFAPGQDVTIAMPARDLMISLDRPVGISARNAFAIRIEAIEQNGQAVWLTASAGDNEIIVEVTAGAGRELKLAVGMEVYAVIKVHGIRATAVHPSVGR